MLEENDSSELAMKNFAQNEIIKFQQRELS